MVRPRVFAHKDKVVSEIPTVVRVRLLIETISKLSEVDMEMTVTFTLYQLWNDARLKRKSQIDLVVPNELIDKIWKPDIAIQGATKTTEQKTTINNDIMRVCPNGDVHYWAKLTSTISCQMYFNTFPLDRQKCQISLYSFGFYSDEVWLYWHKQSNAFYASSVDTLASFRLDHYSQTVESIEYCPDGLKSPSQHAGKTGGAVSTNILISAKCVAKNYAIHEFEFERYFISVFFVSYLPALTMVILGGLSTFIDPKSSPARVGMGITSVLTISTVIQGLKSQLPKVNYLTALDVYLWTCFFFVGFCLVEYAYINYKTIVLPNERKLRRLSITSLNRPNKCKKTLKHSDDEDSEDPDKTYFDDGCNSLSRHIAHIEETQGRAISPEELERFKATSRAGIGANLGFRGNNSKAKNPKFIPIPALPDATLKSTPAWPVQPAPAKKPAPLLPWISGSTTPTCPTITKITTITPIKTTC